MTPAPDAFALRARRALANASRLVLPFLWISAAFAQEPEKQPEPPVLEAREISVTATRGERDVLDVPAQVTVIDRAAIERSGAANLPELLRREAGLMVTNTTTNLEGYSLEARGFQNGGGNGCRTLVLVDGRRANEPDTGCPDWTFLTLDNVERVEVMRGAGSAAYGDNALGGVIQIFTRGAEGGSRGALHVERASFDSERVDGFASTAIGPFGVALSGSFDDTAGFRERSDFNGKRAQLDLSYALGDLGRVSLGGGYASTERNRPNALFTAYATRDGEDIANPGFANLGTERERFVQALVELNLPGEISLRAVPYFRRSRSASNSESAFGDFTLDDETDVAGLDVQISRDFELLSRPVRLIAGSELRQDDIDSVSNFTSPGFDSHVDNSARRQIWALFVQAEAALADAWLLSVGVRHDDSKLRGTTDQQDTFSQFGARFTPDEDVWSPRAALTWRAAEPLSLYVSYSRGFRFANLNEAFGAFGFAPELGLERSHGVELGGKWRSERIAAGVALYQMRVDDEIFFNPFAPNPVNPFFDGINDNVDEVRHRGVELSTSWSPLEWLELYGAYTYDDVEVREYESLTTFEGEQLPITPTHRGNLGARATLPFGFEASAHASYVGERRLANDVEGALDLRELPPYATYDARIAWTREVATGVALTLEGVGRNLTNRHYSEWGGFSTFSSAVGFFPAPERNFAVGARITVER